jgi:acyl-[acyl-carrier-protein]-phospholipid O-acyltransferase/long-chain-fatty-acid--[acyl-carrier-protein] ligase
MHTIPIAGGNRSAAQLALGEAREALRQGHIVCIFAEGAISRTGNLLPFKRGFERMLDGLDVPIIPLHLDRVWGSLFSFQGGRFGWKWPRRLPYPVTVSCGAPLPSTATAGQVRQAIAELGSTAVAARRQPQDLLHRRFIATARRHWSQFCMADASGKMLTFGQALIGSLLLARWLRRAGARDARIGLLLPASVGGALANIAVFLAGKVPVNLNFTAGREAMDAAVRQGDIGTILTARQFLHKARIEASAEMVYLEDILQHTTWWQKLHAACLAWLLPTALLQRLYTTPAQTAEALATVVFSSGTTGIPKGVMLSHHNIVSNIEGIEQVFHLTPHDRLLGILPFFHAFGFTATLWFPLVTGCGAVYHPNPLDASSIGGLAKTYRATMLVSTPTFCNLYLRQCPAEAFASLRYAIVGAEKLRPALAQAFYDKYGVTLLEGYGCTEMAPVVAVNVPDVVHGTQRQIGHKPGTVGQPLPGVAAQVVHPDTGAPVPYGSEGLLLVKGPNRMLGYLGQPQATAAVFQDDWYITGDIATIDQEGFICLTDRLSRFSKIGGEMVPHGQVEEALNSILGEQACTVTAIADAQKGETLVAVYAHPEIAPDELWRRLCHTDLPRLWLPRREHMLALEAIPTLATGKVDMQQVKRLAMENVSASGQAPLS